MNWFVDKRGFNLLEIIVVLLLVGTVGMLTLSRVFDDPVELTTRAETIKSHIRYAQTRAMNADNVWGIRYDGGTNTYRLFEFDGVSENTVRLPAEDADSVDLSADDVVLNSFSVVSFDTWGRPHTNGTATQPGAVAFAVAAGSATEPITITAETGFIP